jgi:GTP cyclohydrolase I
MKKRGMKPKIRVVRADALPKGSAGDPREARLAHAALEILRLVGENPGREGLLKTPQRVAKSWLELTSGYGVDICKLLNGAVFEAPESDMVVVTGIQFYSLCEHHLLPFHGKCSVAYIPNGKIIGLSKIPRLVEAFTRRLQVQERLTSQIADTIEDLLSPQGVGVVMEARHLCMEMRGARSIGSPTKTSAMRGVFRKDSRTRKEFLDLITHSQS